MSPGNLPIRLERESVRDALVYYWGRGIPVDPSHLWWPIVRAPHEQNPPHRR